MHGEAEMTTTPPGQLAANGMHVRGLQMALSNTKGNAELVPNLVRRILKENAWREYLLTSDDDHVYTWKAKDFRKFLTAPREEGGCQTPLDVVARMLKGTDIYSDYCVAIGGEQGGANNPVGLGGKSGKTAEEIDNRDNVTVVNPIPEPSPDPPRGNSTTYAVRRLARERPDLLERVKRGEISAHAAMVEAGFKDKAITIPADPRKAARVLVRHFSREEFSQLVDEMLNHYRST